MATATAVSTSCVNDHTRIVHAGQMLGDVPGQPDSGPSPHVGDHLDVAVDVTRATYGTAARTATRTRP